MTLTLSLRQTNTLHSSFLRFNLLIAFSCTCENQQHTSKSITPNDDYRFTLSDETSKFVEQEFRETDDVRRHAIEALREWAERNPRINKIRLDSSFLLRFLRARKFSLPMTRENVERYLVLRWHIQEGVEVFRNLDVRLPMMQELLDLG